MHSISIRNLILSRELLYPIKNILLLSSCHYFRLIVTLEYPISLERSLSSALVVEVLIILHRPGYNWCWRKYHISALHLFEANQELHNLVSPWRAVLNLMNPLVNYFLYVRRHKDIRLAVKYLFTCKELTEAKIAQIIWYFLSCY